MNLADMTGNCLVLVKAVMMVLMKELRDSLWVPLMGVESKDSRATDVSAIPKILSK